MTIKRIPEIHFPSLFQLDYLFAPLIPKRFNGEYCKFQEPMVALLSNGNETGDVDSELELPPPPPLDRTAPARAARAHRPDPSRPARANRGGRPPRR
ncbi:hypothetical protein V6N13_016877 [Hibiscus sabdariffa]